MEELTVIVVKQKKFTKEHLLLLVEGGIKEDVVKAFEYVRAKLPVLDHEKCFISEMFFMSNPANLLEFRTRYINETIEIKIKHTEIDTYYIKDVYISVNEIKYHNHPVSMIHIQTKRAIVQDRHWLEKKEEIEENINNLMMDNFTVHSIIETSTIYDWNENMMEYWENIMKKNNIGIIFYDISVNTIIGVCGLLSKLSEKYGNDFYVFFVDAKDRLYKVEIIDSVSFIPINKDKQIL